MSLEIIRIKAAASGGNLSYLVFSPRTREGLIIDPSFSAQELLARAGELGLRILFVVNTHGHRDHVEGNRQVMAGTGALLAASPLDLPGPDIPLEEGSTLELGGETLRVLHTPGHSPGSLCLLLPSGDLFTGDTLFVTKVGRADLAGGNPRDLYASLIRLAALPGATRIHPGHDYGPRPTSTMDLERKHNPYLRCAGLEEFIRLRMGG
jgi:glyoxylase-like metal-dependent hydrolase (beta-lactamase superfamily II)